MSFSDSLKQLSVDINSLRQASNFTLGILKRNIRKYHAETVEDSEHAVIMIGCLFGSMIFVFTVVFGFFVYGSGAIHIWLKKNFYLI